MCNLKLKNENAYGMKWNTKNNVKGDECAKFTALQLTHV